MIFSCEKIIDDYLKWIKDNTEIKHIKKGEICSISTPFLDRFNDHLEIYAIKKGENVVLTDDGYTLENLKMSGLSLNSPKREQIFKTLLNSFGVKVGDNNDIYIEANISNIGQKKHYLIQALLSVDDMYTLSQENVYSLFKEDVDLFFKSNNFVYSKDIKISGKSGFDHNIDFLVPSYNQVPEKLIKTINTPKKDTAMATIFTFNDILSVRERPPKNFVIYNDSGEQQISNDAILAFNNYGVETLAWSKKDIIKQEFAMSIQPR